MTKKYKALYSAIRDVLEESVPGHKTIPGTASAPLLPTMDTETKNVENPEDEDHEETTIVNALNRDSVSGKWRNLKAQYKSKIVDNV